MRVSLFPAVDRPAVNVRVEMDIDIWSHACHLAGITTTPTQAQLVEALRIALEPKPRLSSLVPAQRGGALAKEVASWIDLEAVPLGRLLRAVTLARMVVNG